jgi:hypothetical protein
MDYQKVSGGKGLFENNDGESGKMPPETETRIFPSSM